MSIASGAGPIAASLLALVEAHPERDMLHAEFSSPKNMVFSVYSD